MKSKRKIIKEEGGLKSEMKPKKSVGTRLLLSFVLTIFLIIAIWVVKSNLGSNDINIKVCRAKEDIPQSVVLTEENMDKYVYIDAVPTSKLPEKYFTKTEDLVGMHVEYEIVAKSVISPGQVIEKNKLLDTMDNPVLSGIAVDHNADAVNGRLRAGDIVDIVMYDDKIDEIIRIKNVYIEEAFDSSGVSISNDDKETLASNVNIYIEKEYSSTFATHLRTSTIFINKVSYDPSEKLFIPSDSSSESMKDDESHGNENSSIPPETETNDEDGLSYVE